MRGTALLNYGIMACLLLTGLEACVGIQPPPRPATESVQPPPAPKGEKAHRLAVNPTEPVSASSAPPGSASQPDAPLPSTPCSSPETKAKSPLAGESSGCYALRSGTKKRNRGSRRCEPQSLPYARCRSGIHSCNLNAENGPLTWFACEKNAGDTSLEPQDGSILILAANRRHNMPTGHVMYVESVSPLTSSTCKLILSHTNYDRRCSKETNIEATYDRRSTSIDIHSGAWKAWGQDLKISGFILR